MAIFFLQLSVWAVGTGHWAAMLTRQLLYVGTYCTVKKDVANVYKIIEVIVRKNYIKEVTIEII